MRCRVSFKKQLILLLVISFTFCLSVSADDFGKIEDSEWAIGAPADYPEADAVILFEKRNMQVTIDKIIIDHHVRIKILTKAGIEEVGEQSFRYHKDDKIKDFKAHTITPDGKKHKVEKDAVFEKESGYWRTKSFAFPALEEGCIIEYRYTNNNKRHWYLKPWYFQNEVYTMLSEFTVELYTGFEYDYITTNIIGAKKAPSVSERLDPTNTGFGSKKIKSYTWSLENLPPIKNEPYMSSKDDYRSGLRFQLVSYTFPSGSKQMYVETWQEKGNNAEIEFDDYNNKEGDIKKLAEKITAGITDEYQKSIALFEYVRDNFSTINEYNNWYFYHDKISKALEEKTESAEGKNYLLAQLHKAIGLNAWPLMISTRDNSKFDPRYPDIRQFNYIIAVVQYSNSWEFLDVSRRKSIFGILPPNCLTEGGLMIDGNNSNVIQMTPKQLSSYRCDTTVIYIDEAGQAVCSTKCRLGGYYASEFAESFDKNTLEEFIEKYFRDRIDGICAISDSSCYLDSNNVFVMNFDYETDDIVRKLDTDMSIKPVTLSFDKNPFKSERRFFPVDFNFPFIYQNVVHIKFAQTPTEIYMPDDIKKEIGGAAYYRVSKYENGVVEIMQQLVIDKPLFRPGSYVQLKALFEEFAQSTEDEVALVVSP